jgi:hypothetical protein
MTEGPVLVVVDGSEVGWLALGAAVEYAGSDGCTLVCMSVAPLRLTRGRAAHFDPESDELDIDFAERVLAETARRCRDRGIEPITVRRTGSPVAMVIAEALDRHARRIVVGRRPRLAGFAPPDFAERLRGMTDVPIDVVELPERPLPSPARPGNDED